MASTPCGKEIQNYIKRELWRRGIAGLAKVTQGPSGSGEFGVQIYSAATTAYFRLENVRGANLDATLKQKIDAFLDALLPQSEG
jgi:hypothetical protein